MPLLRTEPHAREAHPRAPGTAVYAITANRTRFVCDVVQLGHELIKANRVFDLIIAPNRAHGLPEPYFIRRRSDYFVQYLMGAAPHDTDEITRPPGPAGASGAATPNDDLPIWR